ASVVGVRARTLAAPRSDVANPATTSSARGNSSTASACAFIPDALDCASLGSSGGPRRSGGELLAHDRVDRASFPPSLELRHHLPHHGANVGCAALDRRDHRGADLVVADRGGKVRAEPLDLIPLDANEIGTSALVVHLDRLATSLDAAPQHLGHVVVGHVA